MLKRLAALAAAAVLALGAEAAPASREVVAELAPTGRLRAAINYGNPVLAQRGPGGEPRGVSVDLARELARRAGVELEVVPFDAAGKVFEAAKSGSWDIAFLAVDPVRAADIAFTSPYVLIEGSYMVRQDSPLRAPGEVDREGVRVAVGRGSAYDLYLTRTLKKAQLVRAPTSAEVVDLFLKENLEVAANVKQVLTGYARSNPGVRMIEPGFMTIAQAMCVPQGRPAAFSYVDAFVDEMKA